MKYSYKLILLGVLIFLGDAFKLLYWQGNGMSSSSLVSQRKNTGNFNQVYMTSLSSRISQALTRKLDSGQDIARIISCWNDFTNGKKVDQFLDDDAKVQQIADCFVEGLTAKSFHDTNKFQWAKSLEPHYKEIYSELKAYESSQLITGSPNIDIPDWLPPRDVSGAAYGPQWKTLGLQDRSVWDADRIKDFPITIQTLKNLKVPSCEVFFAKQGPKSGIKPHSDKNNFIITCHLALDVPENECWIKVGNSQYYWKNGESVIFDTSIVHSTENLSDRTRYVLLIRFWHPDLTEEEVNAFKFIFDYLDHAAIGDEALEQFEMMHILMGKDKPASPETKTLSTSDASTQVFPNKKELKMRDQKPTSIPKVKKGFGK